MFSSALPTLFSFVMTATAPWSMMSRIVCCWGRMRRPLGAALSMGVTSNTLSPGSIKSAQMGKGGFLWGTRCANSSFSSLMFFPVAELTEICGMAEGTGFWFVAASAFVNTTTQDSSFSRMRCSIFKSSSVTPAVLSMTRMAISVLFNTCNDFCTRSCPSSPVSSMPAVSIISTGPRGKSSMALKTGSVVVPGTSATTARLCPVRALIKLDLPALRLPNIPIWTRSPAGVAFKLLI